jgi:hypothetical protein
MKTLTTILLLITLVGCKRMVADYEERRDSVKKICPTCTALVLSENRYYTADTSKQPNVIYQVYFKAGGWYYKASDVDHLVRIN